jgi:hypothetical protein
MMRRIDVGETGHTSDTPCSLLCEGLGTHRESTFGKLPEAGLVLVGLADLVDLAVMAGSVDLEEMVGLVMLH